MHWIDIVWPAMGAFSLALGLIHVLIWFRRRTETAYLAFGCAAAAVAVLAIIELGLMRATSPAQFAWLLRWAMPAMAVLLNSMVAFLWLYFRAGSLRLAIASCVLHALCLLPDFLSGDGLIYSKVLALEAYSGWDGSTLAVPVAIPNPWMLLWHATDAVMLLYFASVIRDLRAAGADMRRRGVLLCAALTLFVVCGSSWAVLAAYGWLHAPFMVNVPFFGVVVAMSYLLGSDVLRTAELNQELATHRDALAHLSRVSLLGELSGAIAHELNQPLTAVLSNAQAAVRFLDQDPPNLAEAREGMLQAIESDKRAGEVIRRLRAMLRQEPIDFQPLDLHAVIDDALKMMRSELMSRGVSISLALAPGPANVRGDRVQLQQVLLNLLSNACDAMAANEGDKRIAIATRSTPGPGIEVSLGDNGVGIRPDDAERIFQPFYTTKNHGMGIGLAVCRTIVQAHRGELRASANTPRGTVMRLSLPVEP